MQHFFISRLTKRLETFPAKTSKSKKQAQFYLAKYFLHYSQLTNIIPIEKKPKNYFAKHFLQKHPNPKHLKGRSKLCFRL